MASVRRGEAAYLELMREAKAQFDAEIAKNKEKGKTGRPRAKVAPVVVAEEDDIDLSDVITGDVEESEPVAAAPSAPTPAPRKQAAPARPSPSAAKVASPAATPAAKAKPATAKQPAAKQSAAKQPAAKQAALRRTAAKVPATSKKVVKQATKTGRSSGSKPVQAKAKQAKTTTRGASARRPR
jgi:hypothetical protein